MALEWVSRSVDIDFVAERELTFTGEGIYTGKIKRTSHGGRGRCYGSRLPLAGLAEIKHTREDDGVVELEADVARLDVAMDNSPQVKGLQNL